MKKELTQKYNRNFMQDKKKVRVVYYHMVQLHPEYEHNTEYPIEDLYFIQDTVLQSGLNTMICHGSNQMILWIDDGGFKQS